MDANQRAAFFGGVFYTMFNHCRDLIVPLFGPNAHVEFDDNVADGVEEISELFAMVDPCFHHVDTMTPLAVIGGRHSVAFARDFRFLPDGEHRRFAQTFVLDFSQAPPVIYSSAFRSAIMPPVLFA
ncbi:hypothetical protein NL676_020487 [Syzygium grande]|nr:hypothetical protein NL676_020487 [Syzygium grande]